MRMYYFPLPSPTALTLFPPTLDIYRDMEFGQDTVPTPPRAAADRPCALRYLVWMRTVDT